MKPLQLQSKRKGAAMALVLLAVVILSAMGVGMLSLGLRSRIFAIRSVSEIAARCAADAGLAKAVFEMNEKLKVTPWDDSSLPQTTDETLPNSDATFSYTVTIDGSSYTVESIGKSGQAQRKAISTLPLQGPFEYAIFTEQSMDLKAGATVDWYNNDDDDEVLQIGTNSITAASIKLKNGATINGDVVVGTAGDVDTVIQNMGATITGDSYASTETYELPSITVPEALQSLPSQGTITNTTTISSSAKYDSINLGNGKIITIDGPVTLYVIGNIRLKNSAQLQIVNDDDASLTLYSGGSFITDNGSAINNLTADAKKLKIYGLDSSTNMSLKNGGVLYGAIYAPNADIVLHNSVEVYGAIIANSFEQKASSDFHYDASLRDVSVNDEAVSFTVKQWSEE